jgi:predicted metalloprotease with PDZ domain
MHSLRHFLRRPLPAASILASIGLVAAPGPAQEGKPQEKKDTMTVTLTPEIHSGVLRIDMDLVGDADGETIMVLPRGPGPNSKGWEKVTDIKAVGAELSARSPEERVLKHAPDARISVSYRIPHSVLNRPFETIVQPTYFSALGSALFSSLKGREPTHFFKWGPVPKGWSVASDLEHASLILPEGLHRAELRSSSLMGGADIVIEERPVGKGRLRVAMLRDSGLDPKAFGDLAGRLAQTSNSLWQDPGFDFFISVTTINREGQSGLGLMDGYALYLPPGNPDQYELRNTLAHEHFHAWVGQRVGGGPAWFREGFTEYYARLVNLRAGTYSLEDYTRRWNETLVRYANSPVRLMADAEANSKFFSSDDIMRLGEDRGSMMAALLDYRLLEASNGKVTLMDVLLKVQEEFNNSVGEGDGAVRLVRVGRQMAGANLQADIDRHLGRGEELLLPNDLFGSCGVLATTTMPKYDAGFAYPGIGSAVKGVDPGSRAYGAGIRDGMILVKREAGTMGDSRVELAWRVKDGDRERVIRYQPVGTEKVKVQELRLRTGLAGAAKAACLKALTGTQR